MPNPVPSQERFYCQNTKDLVKSQTILSTQVNICVNFCAQQQIYSVLVVYIVEKY